MTLRAAAKSDPNKFAGALTRALRENGGSVEVHAIGAGAVNQAIKAIAIARGHVASEGHDLVCLPSFTEVEIDGEARTAMRILVLAQATPVPYAPLMGQNRERNRHGWASGDNDRGRPLRVEAHSLAK